MAFSSEVTGRLGVDTSSVPADLAKAKTAFKQFGSDVEASAAGHGAGAGTKLTNALEHKLLGARHLSTALATALGLNIESIAHSITGALVGGSLEGWKQMGEIADREAQLIEKRIETALTPKGLQEKIKKDLDRSLAEAAGKKGITDTEGAVIGLSAQVPLIGVIAEKLGLVRTEEERRQAISEATVKVEEADLRVQEQKKQVAESHKKLDEFREQSRAKGLTDSEKEKALNEEIDKILGEITSGNLSALEIDQKRHRLIEIDNQQREDALAKKDREIQKEKELLKLRVSLVEAQRKLSRDEAELANKKADRGKLNVDEIANLKRQDTSTKYGEDTHVDTFGLSAEASAAKQTAVEIQRMQKQAEGLRLSGDSQGANALFDQIGVKKQGLVDSGFAKSSEGDEFKELKETIHTDSVEVQKILTTISDVARGKLKNE